jgi:hypothetical protein
MSSTTIVTTRGLEKAMVKTSKTCLTLPVELVHIRKNGMEFVSKEALSVWTEMTVDVESPEKSNNLRCTGVVVGCNGCASSGYVISMIFVSLSPQAQQKLEALAHSPLA